MSVNRDNVFGLPATPVDGQRIRWFEVQYVGGVHRVYECGAEYHVDTPYEDRFPGARTGVPIRDDWMLFERLARAEDQPDGLWRAYVTGRLASWDRAAGLVDGTNTFADLHSAIHRAKALLHKQRRQLLAHSRAVEDARAFTDALRTRPNAPRSETMK